MFVCRLGVCVECLCRVYVGCMCMSTEGVYRMYVGCMCVGWVCV